MDDVDDVDDGSQFTRWTALPTPPSGPCISKQSLAIAESAVGECRSVNCAPPLSAVPALTVMGCPDYPDRWDRPDVAASVRNGARRRCGHCRCCCRGRGRGYGGWRYAPAAGWTTAAAVLVVGTWGVIAPHERWADRGARHPGEPSTRDDRPDRAGRQRREPGRGGVPAGRRIQRSRGG